MINILLYLFIGLIGGAFSGLLGIGGAIIVIPLLVFFLGFSQHLAQGTALAMMVPPVGILAAWMYYKGGFVDIRTACFLAAGFLVGGYFGGQLAVKIPTELLRRVFGAALFLISMRMIFWR
jgi:uncharacterized membrane protein YfcA